MNNSVFRSRDILVGSVPYGSGSLDPDPDPSLFGSGFQDANKKLSFFAYFFL